MPSPASTPNNPVLRLDSVSLGYGDFTVLRDISLEVSRGQVVAMMGGSGSGKTTLLRAATGQLRARAGVVTLFDQDLAQTDARQLQALRQRMGVLFQQGALFTDLNVFENVAFPLREHASLSQAEMLSRVLNGRSAITADMAIRVGLLTRTTPESWLNNQVQWDLWQSSHKPKPKVQPLQRTA